MACMMNNQMTCMHVNVRCMRLAICTRVIKENRFKVMATKSVIVRVFPMGAKGGLPNRYMHFFRKNKMVWWTIFDMAA